MTKDVDITLDLWIFGQYDKLLPAKANCRALANLMIHRPTGVPVREAALKIANEALELGDFLTKFDQKYGRVRDDAFATAFPAKHSEFQKGLLRYANHFVGSVNKRGLVSGLLVDLKLVNHTNGDSPTLLLTAAGWNFATLQNPVLDGGNQTRWRKFTDDEKRFLIELIARSVPVEDFAYRAILTAITEGADTPDKLDEALRKYTSGDSNSERTFSKSFLSSQRSGAVSRMVDLGLVDRIWKKVRVSYVVTETGKRYAQGGFAPRVENSTLPPRP